MLGTPEPGRNDPCPCGSGLKYKRCCADADERRTRALRVVRGGAAARPTPGSPPARDPETREAMREAARDAPWAVDIAPLPIVVEDAPDGRPVGVFTVAEGFVLDADVRSMQSAEPEDIARVLAERIVATAARIGHWPRGVHVRHESVASALARVLADREVEIVVRHEIAHLDAAIHSLGSFLAPGAPEEAGPVRLRTSSPERWSGWGLPRDLVARIFAAAARFHATKPWTHLWNAEGVTVELSDGRRWLACVMGNAGEEFGLALYSEAADFIATLEADGSEPPFAHLRGSVVTLSFSSRREVPAGMRREIERAGWTVAGADAYPRLWCINTPAGGISRAWASELALALDAIARFATANEALLVTHPQLAAPLSWVDGPTGAIVSYSGSLVEEPLEFALAPGGASGPGADPADLVEEAPAAILGRDRDVVHEFEVALAAGQVGRALSPGTARLHAMIAETFVDFLGGTQGAGLGAVHELDLREFLYEWFPRKVLMNRGDAMRAPVSLEKFFRFLADTRGIVCPWAKPILDDRATYELRWEEFPGGFFWDEGVREWQASLADDFHERVLIPSPEFADVGTWGETAGLEEAILHRELLRRWLGWRDEVIAAGVTSPDEVRRRLESRQHEWEVRPHPRHDGRSPAAVVREERARRPT